MKNILIVCIQGLTSSIMAKKLTMCTKNHEEAFVFRATSIESIEEYKEWADVILITPQIESSIQKIKNITGEKQIKILAKSTLAIGSPEMTYKNIKKILVEENEKISFINVLKHLLYDAFYLCLVVLLLGSVCEIFYIKTQMKLFHELYIKSAGVLYFYMACFLGGRMGHYTNESKQIFGMMGLSTVLTFVIGNIKLQSDEGWNISLLYKYGSYKLGIVCVPGFIALLSIFYVVYKFIHRCNKKRNYIVAGYLCAPNVIAMMIYHMILCIIYFLGFSFYTSIL